jgi:hypothetical protein
MLNYIFIIIIIIFKIILKMNENGMGSNNNFRKHLITTQFNPKSTCCNLLKEKGRETRKDRKESFERNNKLSWIWSSNNEENSLSSLRFK